MFEDQFRLNNLKFVGGSVAGISTSILMPELDICFDVAQGLPYILNCGRFFITHGHMDHASGIPYIISQKTMYHHKPAQFFLPEHMIEPLTEIMRQWMKIENHQYHLDFRAVKPGERIAIRNDHFVVPFQTVHRIPSQGYTLFGRNKHLKKEYKELTPNQLANLRRAGEELNEYVETPLVSFTGDTQIEFLDLAPFVRKSKILFIEVTYLDDRKPISHAKKWGHIHLSELAARIQSLECEHIGIMHISRRYSAREALDLIKKALPKSYHQRLFVVPPFHPQCYKQTSKNQ